MDIRLDLSEHCIETEIKRTYNRALSRYFKREAENQSLEQTIDLLHRALEAFDFPKLRSRYPVLDGGSSSDVFLASDDNDQLTIMIDRECVEPFLRDSA